MSVTVKASKKFKADDKIIIKCGERKGWHGIIQAEIRDNEYAIVFPCYNPHLAYFYPEEGLRLDKPVDEIMTLLKKDRLNPISAIDRSYARGWIECEYYRETITLDQRDELYKLWGIE